MVDSRDHASIPQLVRQLVEDGEHLLRAETRLAKAQAQGWARAALPGAIAALVGGVFLFASLFTFLAALIGWLTPRLGAGGAALAVTLGTALLGGGLVAFGVSRFNTINIDSTRARRLAARAKDSQP